MCLKSMETEAVFTKTEINNKWITNYLPIVLLLFIILILASFTLVEALLNFLLRYDTKRCGHIPFIVHPHIFPIFFYQGILNLGKISQLKLVW